MRENCTVVVNEKLQSDIEGFVTPAFPVMVMAEGRKIRNLGG